MSRQVVLDTETTGLDPASGHRIIEIGCVELRERRLTGKNLHLYLQPDREIDPGAIEVHGITNEFLQGKPRFADIVEELHAYLDGSELIIHNASFDVGFLENEWSLLGQSFKLSSICRITDSLAMARKRFPGQRNSLDALCKRMDVNNAHRSLHGALLDSEILADVYLRMTGGQTALLLDEGQRTSATVRVGQRLTAPVAGLPVVAANDAELEAHGLWMQRLDERGENAWRRCLDE